MLSDLSGKRPAGKPDEASTSPYALFKADTNPIAVTRTGKSIYAHTGSKKMQLKRRLKQREKAKTVTPKPSVGKSKGTASKESDEKKQMMPHAAYEYTKLADLFGKPRDRVHVWGIIITELSPIKKLGKTDERYKRLVLTKLYDESLNDPKGVIRVCVPLTLYGKLINLPQSIIPGSIIRLHRADVRMHDGYPQLNCDEIIKGSWLLFSGNEADGTVPLAYDKETYTWGDGDEATLRRLRALSTKIFS